MLREVQAALSRLRGGAAGRPTAGQLLDYLDWVGDTERALRGRIRPQQVESLVRTRKFDHLLSFVGRFGPDMQFSPVNGLLASELRERSEAFASVSSALEEQIERWSMLGTFVVFDTNVYLHHPSELEAIDFREMLGTRSENVHLLVPMVVVDELDNLKRDNRTRTRARTTLRKLDQLFARTIHPAVLRDAEPIPEAGPIPHGQVTVEILGDPPDHRRQPIPDDEIVDRVVAAQPLAGREIRLVTYDTGMAMRARFGGLTAVKLQAE